MTMRKAAAILSLLGLILSLPLLLRDAQAAAKSSRALSPAELAATRGAGWGICDKLTCTGTSGCTDGGSAWIEWHPKYVCKWALYGSCTNFATGTCWKKWYYASQMCPDPNYFYGTGTSSIDYCGLG